MHLEHREWGKETFMLRVVYSFMGFLAQVGFLHSCITYHSFFCHLRKKRQYCNNLVFKSE